MQDAIDIKVLQTLGIARDRPSPYGEVPFFTVARGPVPRDLSPAAENARGPETPDDCCSARGMARDRPSPYGESGKQDGEGQALALRERGAFFSP